MTIPTIRVHGDHGLLSVVPALLGFHPADSVVIIALTSTGRAVFGARVDIADAYADADGIVTQIVDTAHRHDDVVAAVIITYGAAGSEPDLAEMLTTCGLPVVRTVSVGNDACEIDTTLHAEVVAHGTVIHSSRDELRTRVEYNENSSGRPDPDLLNSLRTPQRRDELIATLLPNAAVELPRLLEALQHIDDKAISEAGPIDPEVGADLATVAAILAYRLGNGALANLALNRALRINPHHRLAHLMGQAIQTGLPPAELDSLADIPAGNERSGVIERRRHTGHNKQ